MGKKKGSCPVYKCLVKKFSNEHQRMKDMRLEESPITKHKCQRPAEKVSKTENAKDEKGF
jgi:hypothetical protein